MTHHITSDRLMESAIKAVTEEQIFDFNNTLRSVYNRETTQNDLSHFA